MIVSILLSLCLGLTNLETSSNFDIQSEKQEEYISFELLNKSAKSIPLIIPGVMNPNLSPFSNSGVSLKIGQKIFFKEKSKRHLLLEVDGSLKDQKLNVSELLKKRRKELGLTKN